MEVKIKAYAKINLMLDIISRRNDGYHDLFMIMQSVGVYDTVTVKETSSSDITIKCNLPDIPTDNKNIAYKAAEAFFKDNNINNKGIEISIEKRIPHAAGLAGGSADGAAVIKALNIICKTNLTDDEMCKTGVKIGADLPFCITGGTLLSQGIGEVLSKVKPFPKCHIVLVKPDIDINTGKAFGQFDKSGKNHTPDKLGMLCALQNKDLGDICSKLENVFEQFINVPERIEIKNTLRKHNALGACMSGSGPTVYGIFENKEDAQAAFDELKKEYRQVFLCNPVRTGCRVYKIIE